jgi:MFS family permease
MTETESVGVADDAPGGQRVALLLAMAMFVLVVDTSLMNVSISAVVRDLDTTVSGGQSAIALEALVPATFILIGSKVGDLIGRKRAYVLGLLGYALVGASAAIAAAVGMGGIVLGILAWQEGGESVVALLAIGAAALGGLTRWLVRRKRREQPTLLEPELFGSEIFRFGITGQMLQQIALGGTMIALPIYLQMVLEYDAMQAGLSLAPLSLSMFGMALLAGKKAGGHRPSSIIRSGFALYTLGVVALVPIVPRADSGWYLVVPLIIAGSGLGLLVSQLNNYTLSPISEERVSEAAGVNSAAGSFGLSFGLAFGGAILLAALSITFTNSAEASTVLAPDEQQRVADALEDDAEVMTNTHLEELLVDQPDEIREEIVRINTDARPFALQVALIVPIVAGLVGLLVSFRMMRLPDPAPSAAAEGMALG